MDLIRVVPTYIHLLFTSTVGIRWKQPKWVTAHANPTYLNFIYFFLRHYFFHLTYFPVVPHQIQAPRHPNAPSRTWKDLLDLTPSYFSANVETRNRIHWGTQVHKIFSDLQGDLMKDPPNRSNFTKLIHVLCGFPRPKSQGAATWILRSNATIWFEFVWHIVTIGFPNLIFGSEPSHTTTLFWDAAMSSNLRSGVSIQSLRASIFGGPERSLHAEATLANVQNSTGTESNWWTLDTWAGHEKWWSRRCAWRMTRHDWVHHGRKGYPMIMFFFVLFLLRLLKGGFPCFSAAIKIYHRQ